MRIRDRKRPIRIVAKNGHKVKMDDWALARMKRGGTKVFHKCPDTVWRGNPFTLEGEIFYVSLWRYYNCGFCNTCRAPIPADVAITADMMSRMDGIIP